MPGGYPRYTHAYDDGRVDLQPHAFSPLTFDVSQPTHAYVEAHVPSHRCATPGAKTVG
jgi:hypothetical protein